MEVPATSNSTAPIPWYEEHPVKMEEVLMDGGELQLEDEEQLWDPVRDEVPKATEGGDQEEEELLRDPALELYKSYTKIHHHPHGEWFSLLPQT